MSALASEPLEVVAPMAGPTRACSERLRLISTPRRRFIGPSFPEELFEIWIERSRRQTLHLPRRCR